MIPTFSFRRAATVFAAGLLAVTSVFAATDRKFTTSTSLAAEAQTLVNILERAHYNRDAVRSTDYKDVIPDYMGELDGQRLFFLNTDKAKFLEDWGKSVYYNTAFLGNIDPAYRIFEVYQTRVENRINWILEALKKDFDFSSTAP